MERALESVAQQDVPRDRLEAIVVSNASTDRTAAVSRAARAKLADLRVTLIEVPEPGTARAKNLGAEAAGGELLLFLDADSRMSRGLARALLARAAAGERAASIRIVADGDDPLDRAFFWIIEHGKRLFGIRANLFYCDAALFRELGGFDESLNHAEDLEFLVRAKRAGVRVGHIAGEWIATSPRRLHRWPLRIGMLEMFGRWTLGHFGIGRRWRY